MEYSPSTMAMFPRFCAFVFMCMMVRLTASLDATSSATTVETSTTNSSAAASSNLQEDAVPFGNSFLGGSAFGANPALNNFRFRNDLQTQAGNVPYSQPNCLGHQPGMYGSPTYQCQVFFICQADGRLDPMNCPQGTRFNNYLGVCDWPQKVDANCNPIYSENYERYGALASLYGNDPSSSQYRFPDTYQSGSLYAGGALGGVGFEGSARISHHNRHRVPARRLLLDVVHKGSNSLQVVPSYDAYEFLSKQYGFTCQDKKSGYYGDFLYECRIFHVCHSDGRRDTFFCPALTRFNDVLQICDWQHKIDQHCRPLYAIPTDTSYDGKETYLLPSIQALFRPDDLHPYSANFKPSHQLHHATEKPYRNKYQEQEYYQSVYSQQQEPRLKFLLETQVPGPFAASRHPHIRFVPKQAFIENRPDIQAPAAEVNVLIAHGSGSLLPNDRSPAHEDDSGGVRAATETDVDVETPDHQEEKADDSPVPESKLQLDLLPAKSTESAEAQPEGASEQRKADSINKKVVLVSVPQQEVLIRQKWMLSV
ncbi:hypothetical protein BV898_04099 [Hypsibius exemplaris]|uniref:Chitin-binding type-2 domain-containing protein n=1 Tax=Hypsibius exemplaris TaxID=2072580 RepID=A0A1W0X2Z8_HYPEX|nr:hypothetical protein BV898_04099 [Hypsibius exemplaris]